MADFSWDKLGQGATSGFLQGLASGSPEVALLNAALQGALSGFSGTDEFDDTGFRNAFKRLEGNVLRRADREAAAIGSRTGTELAARGLDRSLLGQDIAAGRRNFVRRSALDKLADAEINMEMQIAGIKEADRLSRSEESTQGWSDVGALLAQNVDALINPTEGEAPGLAQIREMIGLGDFNIGAAPKLPDGTPLNMESPIAKKWTDSPVYRGMITEYADAMGLDIPTIMTLFGGTLR